MDFKHKSYQQVLILFIIHCSLKLEAATTEFLPDGRQCSCAGDRLLYNCSVVGGTATRWKGSLLNCPLDVITLRHSQFESNQAFESCNNGDISGYGIRVINNCYTSQLNVTVRESFNNKTVQCILNSNEGTRIIGESLLSVVSATNPYPPPDNLYLANAQAGKLIFNWSSIISNNCYILQHYSITSDCGICPTVTNMTTATCSDLQLTTNAVTCHFRVSSHACDLVGNPSSPIVVTLKVPNVPQVELVPSYSNDSQALEKIFIVTIMNQTEDLFNINGGITGSPTSYTVHTLNLVSGTSFNSTVRLSSCEEGNGCPIELPNCSQSTIINISVSAANILGEGPRSNPFMIECTNNFVQVVYKQTESTISCAFLNPSDTSEKTCCITYQLCDQRGPQKVQQCNKDLPLKVSGHSSQRYCYTVTASNDTYIVKVEGTFTLGGGSINTAAVAAGVIVSFIFIVLLFLGTGIIVWIILRVKSKRCQPQQDRTIAIAMSDFPSLEQYLIPYRLPDTLKLHNVPSDCELQEHITETLNVDHGFRRGHTYYEFTDVVENILEGKEVLLQDKKKPKKWFQLVQPRLLEAEGLTLYGEGIARNHFGEKYKVFIQSFGSGARHLPCGSSIYYNHSENQVQPDVLPLVPVCSEHFAHKVIEEECEVQHFCTQNRLNTTAFNIFLIVEHLPEGMRDQPPRDVILMNKASKELFTGPFAREMLDPRNGGESQNENEKWKVFALLEKNKQGLVFKKGSEVLYQDSMYRTGNFMVLDVDQDCVRMTKFIETKLNCKFEDGRAFYEVIKNEENLLYYKKILRPQTNKLGCEELKLQSLIEYFYAIPGVPAKAMKPDKLNARLQHCKVFIQSTSQGSRCLRKGTRLLYLKEYIKSNPIDVQTDDQPDDTEVDSTARSS